jgi:hypothetical protein
LAFSAVLNEIEPEAVIAFRLRYVSNSAKEVGAEISEQGARVQPSSLSDLTLIYCGNADFGHFSYSFSLNRTTIRLKRAQKLT